MPIRFLFLVVGIVTQQHDPGFGYFHACRKVPQIDVRQFVGEVVALTCERMRRIENDAEPIALLERHSRPAFIVLDRQLPHGFG